MEHNIKFGDAFAYFVGRRYLSGTTGSRPPDPPRKVYVSFVRKGSVDLHEEKGTRTNSGAFRVTVTNGAMVERGNIHRKARDAWAALEHRLAEGKLTEDEERQIIQVAEPIRARLRPCPVCSKPGHRPQDHAGWDPTEEGHG